MGEINGESLTIHITQVHANLGSDLKHLGIPIVKSPHPSPMSARYGFFGSRPFSRANALLVEQGAEPVDWSL